VGTRPESPNLYWALTALPRPFVDARRAFQFERVWLLFEFPQLQNLGAAPLSPAQAEALVDRLIGFVNDQEKDPNITKPTVFERWRNRKVAAAASPNCIPRPRNTCFRMAARASRSRRCRPPRSWCSTLRAIRPLADEMFGWYGLPYPQGARATHGVRAAVSAGGE